MIGTAFFQTLQTQRASPQGAASSQQQMILRVMPLFFGFIGFSFPAGLVLYWTVSNLFMIGQQTLLLRAGHIGPDALERRMAEQKAKMAAQADKPREEGLHGGHDGARRAKSGSAARPRPKKNAVPNPKKGGSGTQRKPKRPGSGGKHGA